MQHRLHGVRVGLLKEPNKRVLSEDTVQWLHIGSKDTTVGG